MRPLAHITRPEGLPPAITQPASPPEVMLRSLGARAAVLAHHALAGRTPLLAIRTGSRVDTGSWFGQARVSLLVLSDRLILLAPGPTPVIHETPMASLGQSNYNHVTGCLLLAPAPGLPRRELALSPSHAFQILAQIYREVSDHA